MSVLLLLFFIPILGFFVLSWFGARATPGSGWYFVNYLVAALYWVIAAQAAYPDYRYILSYNPFAQRVAIFGVLVILSCGFLVPLSKPSGLIVSLILVGIGIPVFVFFLFYSRVAYPGHGFSLGDQGDLAIALLTCIHFLYLIPVLIMLLQQWKRSS